MEGVSGKWSEQRANGVILLLKMELGITKFEWYFTKSLYYFNYNYNYNYKYNDNTLYWIYGD